MAPQPGLDFALPVENDAPHRCVTLSIPGDEVTISNFIGALNQLSLWYNYRRDTSKRGKDIAEVWKRIVMSVEFDLCAVPPIQPIYYLEDEVSPIRVDCDCNVFVTCCDGTEIQLATLADVRTTNQPGSGTRPPIGHDACYPVTLNAKNTWLLPFSVSTDDIITVSGLAGAWSSDGVLWTCPDGTPFVGGLCIGSRYHQAGDPSGTLYHGQLAIMINGNYYSATDGAFTVPGGVSNASCYLIANLERVLSAAGDVVFKVCVTNGATPPATDWCAYLDFTLSDYGFVPDPSTGYAGVWTAGIGWHNDTGIGGKLEVKYTHPVAKTWRATSELYCYCSTPNASGGANANVVGVGNVIQTASVSMGDFTAAGGGADQTGTVWSFNVQNGGSSPVPSVVVKGGLFRGSGTIPTGWTPC